MPDTTTATHIALTAAELAAVRRLVAAAAAAAADRGIHDPQHLATLAAAARKLEAAGAAHPIRWCAHCDTDHAHTADGVCRRCAAYRRKYNRLPSPETLAATARRREQRRLERVAS